MADNYSFNLVLNDGITDSLPDSVIIFVKESNNAPVLSDGVVIPSSGSTSATFTYSVNYTDADNDSPFSITVSIDGGTSLDLSTKAGEDGDFTNGEIFEYSVTGSVLGTGSHTFQFDASDGFDIATGDTSLHNGPTVSSGGTGGGGGGGGGGAASTAYCKYVRSYATGLGRFMQDIGFASKDGNARIDITKDTVGLLGGAPIFRICIDKVSDPPAVPDDYVMIGDAYNITPAGATFDPGITLTMTLGDLPAGGDTEDLIIAMWDEDDEEWVEITGSSVSTGKISVEITHYTLFAVLLSTEEEAAPASFTISNLSIYPPEVLPGETVTIMALITNTGDLSGSHEVALKIDDVTEETNEVTLDGGDSQTVTFTVTRDTVGTYTVNVNNLTGSFKVKEETTVIPTKKPAEFTVRNLSVSPETVATGESVTVEVDVINTGDLEGSYRVVLLINDLIEDSKNVTVSGGAMVKVTFSVTKDTAETYLVEVNGLNRTFTVIQPITWLLILIIIAAIVSIGTFFFIMRRRLTLFRLN